MQELNWLGKMRSHSRSDSKDCDVVLSVSKEANAYKEGECTIIAFKNRSYAKITQKEHMVIAVLGTRLYFKEASRAEGYKLSTFNKDRTACHMKVNPQVLKLTDVEIGRYTLEWDKNVGCYYIDVANKLED